jgi:hypothetical protein
MKIKAVATLGIFALILTCTVFISHSQAQTPSQPLAASTIPAAQLIQPEDLKNLLSATGTGRPLILQVGSKVMFDQAHIPGSEYVGPDSREEGLQLLEQRVKTLSKNSFVVLYCGCCPWGRCPNVGNAFKTLHDAGYTNVKVLYIADNFGTNWVSKGYPVAQ